MIVGAAGEVPFCHVIPAGPVSEADVVTVIWTFQKLLIWVVDAGPLVHAMPML